VRKNYVLKFLSCLFGMCENIGVTLTLCLYIQTHRPQLKSTGPTAASIATAHVDLDAHSIEPGPSYDESDEQPLRPSLFTPSYPARSFYRVLQTSIEQRIPRSYGSSSMCQDAQSMKEEVDYTSLWASTCANSVCIRRAMEFFMMSSRTIRRENKSFVERAGVSVRVVR
jgi:hypothetical protein